MVGHSERPFCAHKHGAQTQNSKPLFILGKVHWLISQRIETHNALRAIVGNEINSIMENLISVVSCGAISEAKNMMMTSALAIHAVFAAHPTIYRNLNSAARDVSIGKGDQEIRLQPNEEAGFNELTRRWVWRRPVADKSTPARIVP